MNRLADLSFVSLPWRRGVAITAYSVFKEPDNPPALGRRLARSNAGATFKVDYSKEGGGSGVVRLENFYDFFFYLTTFMRRTRERIASEPWRNSSSVTWTS
jgi:hypothetical protein